MVAVYVLGFPETVITQNIVGVQCTLGLSDSSTHLLFQGQAGWETDYVVYMGLMGRIGDYLD